MLCELDRFCGMRYGGSSKAYVWKPGNEAATEDDHVGAFKIICREDHAYFCDFSVKKECRRKGYGMQILQEAMRVSRELGYKLFTLGVLKDNAPAIALYEKAGFTFEELPDGYVRKMRISL